MPERQPRGYAISPILRRTIIGESVYFPGLTMGAVPRHGVQANSESDGLGGELPGGRSADS